jgi:hypothetical protein
LRIESKAKGQKADDIEAEPPTTVRHVHGMRTSRGFQELLEKYVDLLSHGRFENAHRAFRDGLPNKLALGTMPVFIDSIEDTVNAVGLNCE